MFTKLKHTLAFVLILSIVFLSLTTACKDDTKTIKTSEVSFNKEGELTLYTAETKTPISQIDIEIADNEYETQTGLMYRTSMKENQGMLFVFKDEVPRSFYMKNTQFALDIIYLDSNKTIVSFHENAHPLDESSLPSNFPAKYVLEINAGLAAKWNLKVGDIMMYRVSK